MHQLYLEKQQKQIQKQKQEELNKKWHAQAVPDFVIDAKYNECDVTISEESGDVVKLDNNEVLMEQTAIRMRERKLLEQQRLQKQYNLQQLKKQVQYQQQKEENNQIQELRKRMYVKANPVKFQQLQTPFPKVQPRPVTRARTPDFVKRMENRINKKVQQQ